MDEAGEERFRLKVGRFVAMMHEEQSSQVLYRGVMGALGYTKNKEQLEELAIRLPVATLEVFCRGKPFEERVQVLEALLLGTVGLLTEGGSVEMERLWRCSGNGEPMRPSCGRTFRVRPENQPARRLTGAAHLLARSMSEGLVEGVLGLVRESGWDVEGLEAGFMVGAPEGSAQGERALIGRGRAREVVVNIVLPFAYAWAEGNQQAEQALALYKGYPPSGGNEITRGLTKLLGDGSPALVNSACRQQGLIHLDKTYCRERKCGECPLVRRLAVLQQVSC